MFSYDSSIKNVDYSNGYFDNLQKAVNYQPINKGGGSINPPKGLFEPNNEFFRYNIQSNGVRDKFYNLTFRILRNIAGRVAPITSVHTLRTMQIRPFSFRSINEEETGFCIKLKNRKATPSAKEKKEMEEMEEFFFYAGFLDFPGAKNREEGMQEINEQIVRDILSIDQIAISLRKNRKGDIIDYWILDGATIKRTIPGVGFEGNKEIKFVQEVEGKIVETFVDDDLIFYYSNRRTEIEKKGYGWSFLEQSIDIISAWIFGMTYNKEFFNTSSQPKGILTFSGDQLDQAQIEELQRQWISMFRGVKGMWKTPFLQYDAKWQNLAPTNRDMEFNEYIQILSSWIYAIHGTDSQEIGIRLNQAQSVLNDNQEAKISFSKSRALRDLLTSLSTIYTKIIDRIPKWEKYMLSFTGLEAKDQAAESDVDGKQVKSYKTLNEKRAEKDEPPLPYGDIVLDPQYIQHVQAMEAMKMQNQQQENKSEDNSPALDEKEEDVNFEIEEDDLKELEKSLKDDFIEIVL